MSGSSTGGTSSLRPLPEPGPGWVRRVDMGWLQGWQAEDDPDLKLFVGYEPVGFRVSVSRGFGEATEADRQLAMRLFGMQPEHAVAPTVWERPW